MDLVFTPVLVLSAPFILLFGAERFQPANPLDPHAGWRESSRLPLRRP
jgi:hypothetical protein